MISRDDDACIVLVEDPFICRYVRSVLANRKGNVVDAEPADAVRLVQSGDSRVRLLITNRPGNFLPFAAELPVVYVSSQPENLLARAFRTCRTLHKPFAPRDLATAVSELIGPL